MSTRNECEACGTEENEVPWLMGRVDRLTVERDEALGERERARDVAVALSQRVFTLEDDRKVLRLVLGELVATVRQIVADPDELTTLVAAEQALDVTDSRSANARCRCGRPVFIALNDPTPYCPGCEYGPAATCDCAATS